jgi:hypothetical protein
MDASPVVKTNQRDVFTLSNPLIFIGLTDRENGIANHLSPQLRSIADLLVTQIMQCNTIPTAIFNSNGHNAIASSKISIAQLEKLLALLFMSFEFYAYSSLLHKRDIMVKYYFNYNPNREQRFILAFKDRISALSN